MDPDQAPAAERAGRGLSHPPGAAAARGAPVILNCRVAARPTITGVERWTLEVSRRLQTLGPTRYLIAAPRRRRAHSGAVGHAWEQLALPVWAARRRAGAILSPANLAPLAWPCNVVVMHDAAVLREPSAYSRAYRAWHRCLGVEAARRARAVLTVSEFSRGELISLAGLDPARVHVVGAGVDERFSPGPSTAATRFGLERPYVLTIATNDRRKNLEALAECARRLADAGIELVWAGDARPQFARTRAPSEMRSLGYVPDELLVELYRGAEAFVLPSRYEGFGLTCVEAMACGTPVVAADAAALPEVCADAALLVDPASPGALADAVLAACTDPTLAQRLRSAGLDRARRFDWDRVAGACDALLRAV